MTQEQRHITILHCDVAVVAVQKLHNRSMKDGSTLIVWSRGQEKQVFAGRFQTGGSDRQVSCNWWYSITVSSCMEVVLTHQVLVDQVANSGNLVS